MLDVRVVRGIFEGLDHYAVLIRMKMNDKWKFKKRVEGVTKRLRLERFMDEGLIEEYREAMIEVLNDKGGMWLSNSNAEEVFHTLKNVLLSVTEEIVGMKVVKMGKKKGMHGRQKRLRK